jgi:hypothetical protein
MLKLQTIAGVCASFLKRILRSQTSSLRKTLG